MKQFGFYCFSLALLFAISSFSLQETKNIINEKTTEAITIAIAIEQTNLARFEIEQNTDKAIEQAIKQNQTEKPATIKNAADNALLAMLEKEKNIHDLNLQFATGSEKQYSLLESINSKQLEKKDIVPNTKAIVIQATGTKTIQYCFTGSIRKNKIVFAKITNAKAKQFFVLPINYCNQIIVISNA